MVNINQWRLANSKINTFQTKTPHLTELLGANSKRLKEINRFITEQPDVSSKGMQQVAASNVINEVGDGLACEEFGKMYKVNET